ncbi:MAG: hypothetical protein HY815_03510, partial [Candidatus Riflebacteria bacterium]|nr:hypothetical protein [Candidatus Riflebacteria bacterium]
MRPPPSSPPTRLDALADDYPLLRLNVLYASGDFEQADRIVDEIVQIFPGTETAAEALFLRSRHRRAREDHEGALWDLLDAADQGTGEWSLRAAFRAGVHCQMMEWKDRAQVVYERLVAKWPLTLTAARAAGGLAYIHRD